MLNYSADNLKEMLAQDQAVECDECLSIIPDIHYGKVNNRWHASSCSSFDPKSD